MQKSSQARLKKLLMQIPARRQVIATPVSTQDAGTWKRKSGSGEVETLSKKHAPILRSDVTLQQKRPAEVTTEDADAEAHAKNEQARPILDGRSESQKRSAETSAEQF